MDTFVKDLLKDFIDLFRESAKYYATVYKNKQGRDTLSDSDILRDMKVELTDERLVISVYNYYLYIRDGRKPNGKLPNVGAILEWIKRKRIKGRSKNGRFISDNSLAWAISKGIAKNGITPRPFLDAAYDEASGLFNQEFNDELNKMVNNILTKFVSKNNKN